MKHYIKAVYQYNKDGEFIKKWNSMVEAANFYGIHNSNIHRACKSQKGHSKDFQWRYYKAKNIGKYVYSSTKREKNSECLMRLKNFREQKGYTQNYVAQKLNMTPAYYNTIEKHGKVPHLLYIADLMKILDIKFEDLFGGEVKKKEIGITYSFVQSVSK